MKMNNPRLDLFFLSDDAEHGKEQSIGTDGIVRNSISISYQLLNGLKPSSNRAFLTLLADSPAIEDMVRAEGNIGAILADGTDVWFTGFLSTDWNWTVTDRGVSAIAVTIEDVGTRLLKKSFISTGCHLFRCTARKMLEEVSDAAGVSISRACIPINGDVIHIVESGTSCADLLSQMLYEFGYVYFFDSAGELRLFNVSVSDTASETIDGRRLCRSGANAVSLKKAIRKYSNAKVTYTEMAEKEGLLVYRNTTGQDDAHPYCHMELLKGQKFDGTEVWSEKDWNGDESRENALIEACNAESDLTVGSRKIIAVSNVQGQSDSYGGDISFTASEAGGPYLSLLAESKATNPVWITRMDVYGDVLFEKSQCIIRTGSDDGETLEDSMSFVHDKDSASRHAETILRYSRNSSSSYTFFAKGIVQPGSVVRLKEDTHSGLDVVVLVYAVKLSEGSDVSVCSAVGISSFSLDEKIYSRTVSPAPNGLRGEKGNDGSSYTVTVESSNGSVFRKDTASTILSCHVYRNGLEITESLDASRFMWKRNSGNDAQDASWANTTKAMCRKSVEITPEDCPGRTVFFCEVDLPQ